MENINSMDIFIAAVVGLSALLSFSRGFVGEMLGIGSWFLASVAGLYSMPYLSPYVGKYVHNPLTVNLLSIAIATIAALIVLTVVCSRITIKVRKSVLNSLDHFLGFIFGCLRGIVILVLLYFIAMTVAPKNIPELSKGSKIMPYLEKITENVKGQLPESLFDNPVKKEGEESKPSELDELIKKLSSDSGKETQKQIKKLPKEDPLRQSLEELESEKPKAPPEEKELFDLLNSPEVKAKPGKKEDKSGYGQKERDDLSRLIMENMDEVESAVP